MKFPFIQVSNSEEITTEIATQFAAELSEGDIVLLNGNLGSGKTFFVKQLSKFLGIDSVTSPTFSIVNEYYGKFKIFHFDFYRINKLNELHDIGFEEYLDDREAVIFIEWADMFPEILPNSNIYRIDFKNTKNNEREISINFV